MDVWYSNSGKRLLLNPMLYGARYLFFLMILLIQLYTFILLLAYLKSTDVRLLFIKVDCVLIFTYTFAFIVAHNTCYTSNYQ